MSKNPMIDALMNADCGHTLYRVGDSFATVLHQKGKPDISVVRLTFDESVGEALRLLNERTSTPEARDE